LQLLILIPSLAIKFSHLALHKQQLHVFFLYYFTQKVPKCTLCDNSLTNAVTFKPKCGREFHKSCITTFF